jgi:hypothetical protein
MSGWISDGFIGSFFSITTLFQLLYIYIKALHFGLSEITQHKPLGQPPWEPCQRPHGQT